jgi:hypothetical protein
MQRRRALPLPAALGGVALAAWLLRRRLPREAPSASSLTITEQPAPVIDTPPDVDVPVVPPDEPMPVTEEPATLSDALIARAADEPASTAEEEAVEEPHEPERRSGLDRRSGTDRRQPGGLISAPLAIRVQAAINRRSGTERRSGIERRAENTDSAGTVSAAEATL